MMVYILISLLFALFIYRKWLRSRDVSNESMLVVLGSGGHTMEMLNLVSSMASKFPARTYLLADDHSMEKAIQVEKRLNNGMFSFKRVSRSRKVGQSYATSVFTTIVASAETALKVCTLRPSLLLVNGPGTCIPVCVFTALMNSLTLWSTKVIYVESVCRVTTLSLSGLIIYKLRMAHGFFVQWPELAKSYGRAKYIGRLV